MKLGGSSAELGCKAQSYKHYFPAAHTELGAGETGLKGQFSSGNIAEAFKVFSSFA